MFKSTLSEFSSAGAQTEAAPHEGPPVGEVSGLAVVARHPRTRGLGAQAQQPQLLGPGLLQAAPQVGHGLGQGNMVTVWGVTCLILTFCFLNFPIASLHFASAFFESKYFCLV